MLKEKQRNEAVRGRVITSVVKRTKYENVKASIKGVGTVYRDVIVFDNRTDKEIDVYVRMGGKYSDYYYKIMHFNEKSRSAFDVKRLPEVVYEMLLIEEYADFEEKVIALDLLVEKRLID